MIQKISNLKLTEALFCKYFPSYKVGDPYEKVLIYKEDVIMAMISYSIIYERAEINYIVTFPKFRHKGLAQKLLDCFFQDLKQYNCDSISLEVDVNNLAAINLYLKNGFKKQAIRKNYYKNNDAYLMIKEMVVKE